MQNEFSLDSLLAIRFQNARPGLDLIAVVDAAIPVSMVTANVLAQDRKPLPLLEEFVLRLVDSEVTSTDDLTGVLGLSGDMVNSAVADHFSADNLAYARIGQNDTRLQLTARGKRTAQDLASITPVEVELPLIFDRLLWKVRPFDRNSTITRRQAEDDDFIMLPADRSATVVAADITPAEINSQLQSQGNVDRQVLVVKRASPSKSRRVMPAKLLVFADPARTEVQLAVVVDEDLSLDHELALLNLGGAEKLGIKVGFSADRPGLTPELESVRVPLDEVTRQRTQAAAVRLSPVISSPAHALDVRSPRSEVRAVSVFEHADLLDNALTHATRRILLISPWIKRAIVTTDFLGKLEVRLRRNVAVHIAHGYSDEDDKSDADAVRKLENLAKRYPERFTFSRLKSTHAKILIFDDTWIATSFNWLSFRGARDRTYRMEEGTLVRGLEIVDEQYGRYVAKIAEDAV